MKHRWLVLLALAAAALAVETSIGSWVSWRGIHINLTLVYSVCVGLAFGPVEGAIVGFGAGFLQDVYFGRFLGVYGSAHLVAGYVAGLSTLRVFRDYLWLPLAVACALTFLAEGMALVLFRLLGVRLSLVEGFFGVLVPAAVLNGLLAPLVYAGTLRLRRVLENADERSGHGQGG